MWRHAARAVPWWLVGAAGCLVLVTMRVLAIDPWTLWPLQATTVGLVAAGVAWCLDEPSASVVDVCPRGLAWRTTARCLGAGVVVGLWSLAVWWNRTALFGHAWAVWVQGVSTALVTVVWVTWRRSRGESTPGQRFAVAVIGLTTCWALLRPASRLLPVFPYAFGGEYGDWRISTVGWSFTGLAAAGILLAGWRGWISPRRFSGPTPRDCAPTTHSNA